MSKKLPIKMSAKTNDAGGITMIAKIEYQYTWDVNEEVTHKEARDYLRAKHMRAINEEAIVLLKDTWDKLEQIKLASDGFPSKTAEAQQLAVEKEIARLRGDV